MLYQHSAQEVLCVVDPNLKDKLGHHFEYDHSLLAAARNAGHEFIVMGNKGVHKSLLGEMSIAPVFSRTIWETQPQLGTGLDLLLANASFFRALRAGLSRYAASRDWTVFGHMITPHQLLGWVWWLRSMTPERAPRTVMLFRYPAEWFEAHPLVRRAFGMLERLSSTHRLRLASDSNRLAEDYARLTTLPVHVLPIPHTQHLIIRAGAELGQSAMDPISVVSLGNARDEKGFLEILQAIMQLHHAGELKRFRFLIQANDLYAPNTADEILRTIDEITHIKSCEIRFVEKQLDTADYYELLEQADVVLVPYWRSTYSSRTSGILAEAIGAGKVVIATEDTWMSDQLSEFDTGLTCKDRDPTDLARALLDVANSWQQFIARARAAAPRWLKKHNPEALVNEIVRDDSLVPTSRRIGILYPWGDAIDWERRSGGSQYLGLLTDFLKDRYDQIQVLAPGRWPVTKRGNVRYQPYDRPPAEAITSTGAYQIFRKLVKIEPKALRMLPGFAYLARVMMYPVRLAYGASIAPYRVMRRTLARSRFRPILLKLKGRILASRHHERDNAPMTGNAALTNNSLPRPRPSEDYMLWLHEHHLFEPTLEARIEEIVRWADVVLLEYTFWVVPVLKACRRYGKKFILTSHDILAQQVSDPALRRATFEAELQGMRAADYAICVSQEDQRIFRYEGVNVDFIPPAIDFRGCVDATPNYSALEQFTREHRTPFPLQDICLFVGSDFEPNAIAARNILEMARSLRRATSRGHPINFVVAGACMDRHEEGNFLAIGRVASELLHALYSVAALVLIPLPSGTGASIKTIEAMAYGKAILGTPVGLRGYPVSPDVHCVICERLSDYPSLILQLLEDDQKREMLGMNAREFAARYDYKLVYRRYAELIDAALETRTAPDERISGPSHNPETQD